MEEWRAVPGWIGFYEVSNLGRVKSVDRVIVALSRAGKREPRRFRGHVLRPSTLKNGYRMVGLSRPGERRDAYVHDLVMAAFVGPKPPGQEVCHRHGRRGDNHLADLRYGTRSSNALDRHEHGTMNQARGEVHFCAKLTEQDVRWIRANASKYSQREMGLVFGVSHSVIGGVQRGVTWKSVV